MDAVNELVKRGMPFREAYKKVGEEISSGKFSRPRKVYYTHEGSIGNLKNDVIVREMNVVRNNFRKEKVKVEKALNNLQKTSG